MLAVKKVLLGGLMAISYQQFEISALRIFFCQIWTLGFSRHIPGPFLVNFEICQILVTPGPILITLCVNVIMSTSASHRTFYFTIPVIYSCWPQGNDC